MVPIRTEKGQSLLKLVHDYVVVDLETTGFNPGSDEILEIGAIKVVDGEVVEEFHSMVKPKNRYFVTNFYGITKSMVAMAPYIEDVLPGFFEFVGDMIIVGHNVHFDVNFLYDASLRSLNIPFPRT